MRNCGWWIAQLQNGKNPLGEKKRYELGGTDTARNQVLSWRLLRKSPAQFVLKEAQQAQATAIKVKKKKKNIHNVR